jgi:hypothetical protein
MILLLHHRYRFAGGEERAVADLEWLIRSHLGEDVEVLERASASLGGRAAAGGLLAGGLHPEQVARAVRRTGARRGRGECSGPRGVAPGATAK